MNTSTLSTILNTFAGVFAHCINSRQPIGVCFGLQVLHSTEFTTLGTVIGKEGTDYRRCLKIRGVNYRLGKEWDYLVFTTTSFVIGTIFGTVLGERNGIGLAIDRIWTTVRFD